MVSQDEWDREFDENIKLDNGMVSGGTISFWQSRCMFSHPKWSDSIIQNIIKRHSTLLMTFEDFLRTSGDFLGTFFGLLMTFRWQLRTFWGPFDDFLRTSKDLLRTCDDLLGTFEDVLMTVWGCFEDLVSTRLLKYLCDDLRTC